MKEFAPNHIENLIAKYLVDEASSEEIRELQDWCAQSSDNQRHLDEAQLIFQKAQISEKDQFDTEAAWAKVRPQLTLDNKSSGFGIGFWGKIAAAFVLFTALSYLFYDQVSSKQEFSYLSQDQPSQVILPDQTQIALLPHSEAKVIWNTKSKTGKILLSGEATFSMDSQSDTQWLVETENLRVEDIGTVFHVVSLSERDSVEVSVLEGEVRFYSESDPGIALEAGQKGIYSKSAKQFLKGDFQSNEFAFHTKTFDFSGESLQSVVDLLSKVYQTEIQLSGPISTCQITVRFDREELETALSILAETMGLTLTSTEKGYLLSGEACY